MGWAFCPHIKIFELKNLFLPSIAVKVSQGPVDQILLDVDNHSLELLKTKVFPAQCLEKGLLHVLD